MKFCSSREKMRNASGNQGEKSASENKKRKRTRTTFNSSIKRVTRKFYVTKKVCCACKVAFFAKKTYYCVLTVLVAFAA